MTVRLLDEGLINQIAAGEVVERPASVVKELVENALDAGATAIDIELKSGGRTLISVLDDGVGMSRDDAMMSLERHATSKIRTADDLATVGSLGFRGEAVPSIASISRFEMLTRPHDEEVGTRIRIEGGELRDVRDAGCAPGTEIRVRNLFFNVPVRRRFLRTPGTEVSHCLDAVTREAMAHPEVGFSVRHDGRTVLETPKV
ncbi:MAG: ATP-binding protein, partial [Proteobacteria bacterium]|nr:ATP-binding protein [Pseudomonadota bacterium]